MAQALGRNNRPGLGLDALFDSNAFGAVVVDRSGLILRSNNRLSELSGLTGEMLLGGPVFRLLPREFQEGFARLIGDAGPDFPLCGPAFKQIKTENGSALPMLISVFWLGLEDGEDRLLVLFDPNGIEGAVGKIDDLARVFYDLPDAVFLVNPDRTIAMVNPAGVRMFGYELEEIAGETTRRFYPSDAEYERQGQLRYNMEVDAKPGIYVARFKRKNGEIFPGEIIGGPVRNHRNKIIGYLGIIRDASERLTAERLSELFADQLTDAVEGMEEAFALFDSNDRLVTFNSRYRELFRDDGSIMRVGRTFEQILRDGAAGGHYAADGQDTEEWIQYRLRKHREADGSIVIQQMADGRWVQGAERRTKQGGIVGVRTDITSRVLAERKAKNQQRELQLLVDSLPFPVTKVDLNGVVTVCNAAAAEWTGRPRSMMVGRSIVSIIGDENFKKMLTSVRKARTGASQRYELTMAYPDGILRTVEIEHIPDHEEDGTVNGILTLTRDITQDTRREKTLATLYELVNTRQLEFSDKIRRILRLGRDYFGLSSGFIGELTGDDFVIRYADEPRRKSSVDTGVEVPKGGIDAALHITAFAHDGRDGDIDTNHPFFIPEDTGAAVGSPVYIDGRLFGFVFWTSPYQSNQKYVAADVAVARQFAEWIGLEYARQSDIIEMEAMQSELYRLATTDELTGLNNRRQFMTLGEREFQRANRHRHPLAVALFDIDHFKRINDTHGHDVGDIVLRDIARAARSALRETDIIGRIGGEEFAVLLPETSLETAAIVLDRLRAKMADRHQELGDTHVTCTVSIGVALLNQGKGENLELALNRADKALYFAKNNGRNKVAVDDNGTEPRIHISEV